MQKTTAAPARWLRWAGAAALLALMVTLAPHARAGQNDDFGVVPAPARHEGAERRTFTIPLEEGGTFSDAVRIYSRSDEPITLNVYAADAAVDDEGVVSVGFREDRPAGLAGWVQTAEQTVRLGPGEEIVVPWQVHVRGTSPEPALAAIVVESASAGEGALDLVQRIAILVRPAETGAATAAVPVEGADGGRDGWPWIAAAVAVAAAIALLAQRRATLRTAGGERPGLQPEAPREEVGVL